MRLIVGLGNPGRRYRNTWHNLGARSVETLASRWGVIFKPGKGDFLVTEANLSRKRTNLMIPTSFMNRSGGPVAEWVRYYKLTPDELMVIYDDHDLPLGKIRIRERGSSGGHHGMDDIIRRLGFDDFPRLRIGIRTEHEAEDLTRQVLTRIPKTFIETVSEIITIAADAVELILKESISAAMMKYNKMDI